MMQQDTWKIRRVKSKSGDKREGNDRSTDGSNCYRCFINNGVDNANMEKRLMRRIEKL